MLSLAVSDVDECENRASRKPLSFAKRTLPRNSFLLNVVLAQRRQKVSSRVSEMTVSSLNRDFVVSVPGLLGKVLNYACSLPCKNLITCLYFT